MRDIVDIVLVLMPLALAGVWLVSSVAKALTPQQSAKAAELLGVPRPLVRLTPVGLPLLEGALAVGLVMPVSRQVAATASLALLGVFTVLVVRVLSRGERAPCNCFGAISSADLAPRHVVRNVLLGLLALPAALGVEGSISSVAVPWQPLVVATLLVVMAVCIGVMFWLMNKLAAHLTAVIDRVEHLEKRRLQPGTPPLSPGSNLPTPFSPPTATVPNWRTLEQRSRATGESLEDLLDHASRTALVFLSSGCGSCRSVIERRLPIWSRLRGPDLGFAVVLEHGRANDYPREGDEEPIPILHVPSGTLRDIGVHRTPSAVLLDSEGELVSGPHLGDDEIHKTLLASLSVTSLRSGTVVEGVVTSTDATSTNGSPGNGSSANGTSTNGTSAPTSNEG